MPVSYYFNVRQQRFMALVKRLKAAYDVCCGAQGISEAAQDHIYYYLAVRTVVFKLTKGDAPDTEQMNKRVLEMIAEALKSDGVTEIFKLAVNINNHRQQPPFPTNTFDPITTIKYRQFGTPRHQKDHKILDGPDLVHYYTREFCH